MKIPSYFFTFRFWGFVGLLLGNAIGAAMLVMPITVGLSGFFPSALMAVLLALMSLFAAFALVDEAEKMTQKVFDAPMILQKAFGRKGRPVMALLLFFFFTSLLAAYIIGGSKILCGLCGIEGNSVWISLFFGLALTLITGAGLNWVERCNMPLTIFIFISLIYLIGCCFPRADFSRVFYGDAVYTFYTMPVLVAAIGFNNMIPGMYLALDRDGKQLRGGIVIALGMLLFFVLFWTLAVIVAVPRVDMPTDGALLAGSAKLPVSECRSLLSAQFRSLPATIPLSNIVRTPGVLATGLFFSLFALITSFFGVGVSIKGAVRDVLVNDFGCDRILPQMLLAFGPALAVAVFCPNDFVGIMNNVCGPFYVLLFVALPLYLALRDRAYSFRKRALAGFFLVLSCVTIALSVCEDLGWTTIRSAAETECRALYMKTRSSD